MQKKSRWFQEKKFKNLNFNSKKYKSLHSIKHIKFILFFTVYIIFFIFECTDFEYSIYHYFAHLIYENNNIFCIYISQIINFIIPIYYNILIKINMIDLKALFIAPLLATVFSQLVQLYFTTKTVKVFGMETYPYLKKYFSVNIILCIFGMLLFGGLFEVKVTLFYATFFIFGYILYLIVDKCYPEEIKKIMILEIEKDMDKKLNIDDNMFFTNEWSSKYNELYSNETKLLENLILHSLDSQQEKNLVEKNETLNYLLYIFQSVYENVLDDQTINYKYIFCLNRSIKCLLNNIDNKDKSSIEYFCLGIVDFFNNDKSNNNILILLTIFFTVINETSTNYKIKDKKVLFNSVTNYCAFDKPNKVLLKNSIYLIMFWQLIGVRNINYELQVFNYYVSDIESYLISDQSLYSNVKKICFAILFIVLDMPKEFMKIFNSGFVISINYIGNDLGKSYVEYIDET